VNIEVSSAVEFKSFVLGEPARLVIDLKNADTDLVPYEQVVENDKILNKIRIGRPEPDVVRVVLDLSFLLPSRITAEGKNIVVRLPRKIDAKEQKMEVLPGVIYSMNMKMLDEGPITYHVVDLNLNDPKVGIEIGIGENKIGGMEKLSSMVKRKKAAIGINGGYFNMKSGQPIDMLIVRGKLLILPERFRGFFGITAKGEPLFMRPNAELSIRVDNDHPFYVNRLNWPTGKDQIGIFTSEYGESTGTEGARRELIVKNGKITGISASDSNIPSDGFVISGPVDNEFIKSLKEGQSISLLISSYPDLGNIEYGISAGPMLIKNGEIQDKSIEDFTVDSNIVTKRNPRTAIAKTNNKHLIFIVVEGRSTRSIGMTIKELSLLAKNLGAVDAINLDGGGSSELIIGEKIMNELNGETERPIATSVLIHYR